MTVEIGQSNKLFNLAEARELLPLVRAITETHCRALSPIQDRLNKMLSNDPRRAAIEQEFEQVVSQWKVKIEQLGPSVFGLWMVEFDVGEGNLCWRYPEVGLNFFRAHQSSIVERRRLSQYIEETDPDWA